MSEANVETMERFNDAFRRGDWDALAATLDPHVFVRTDPRWPERYIYGREAYMAFSRGARESLGPDIRLDEIVDLGDRVLVRACWSGRGPQSGVEGEQRFSSITTYRDGRAVFTEFFIEHEQALEALGMRE